MRPRFYIKCNINTAEYFRRLDVTLCYFSKFGSRICPQIVSSFAIENFGHPCYKVNELRNQVRNYGHFVMKTIFKVEESSLGLQEVK